MSDTNQLQDHSAPSDGDDVVDGVEEVKEETKENEEAKPDAS